jgi:hypothetical protein
MCQCLALPRQMQQALPRLTHATAKFGPSGTAMAMKLVGLTQTPDGLAEPGAQAVKSAAFHKNVKADDVVIQQATNHAWINRGTQPCRILFVLMDSKQP